MKVYTYQIEWHIFSFYLIERANKAILQWKTENLHSKLNIYLLTGQWVLSQ